MGNKIKNTLYIFSYMRIDVMLIILDRYMGTITGIGDLDPTRWPGSKWRNLEVSVNMCPSSVAFSNAIIMLSTISSISTLSWC